MAQLCSGPVSSKGSGKIPTKLWEQRQIQCVGVLKIYLQAQFKVH